MRLIQHKLEYMIICQCGTKYTYDINDMNKPLQCHYCHYGHTCDGSHDLYMLEKVKINEQDRIKLLPKIV